MVGGPPDPPDSGGSGNPMILQGNTLELTRAELRALLAHASKDEQREHLCAVIVEPGHCPPRIWTTDGYRAAVAVAQCGDTVGTVERTAVVVPRQPLDQALRLAGSRGRTIRIRIGPREDAPDGVTALGAPTGMVSVEVVDGQTGAPTGAAFWARRTDAVPPPLDNVLPDPDPTPGPRAAYVHLDPALLADLQHVVSAAESDPHPHASASGIRVYSPVEAEAPLSFTCGAWTAVIMPTKGVEGGELRPKAPPAPRRDTLRRDDVSLPEGKPATLPKPKRKGKAA